MKNYSLSRRNLLTGLGAAAGLSLFPGQLFSRNDEVELSSSVKHNFSFCLNTSTIMGQKVGLVKEIEIAAKAGYDAIEIWIRSLEQYLSEGGNLKDLKKRIDDLGIKVADAIGFAPWIVDDNDTRIKALEQAKKEMDMLAQIGCPRLAAPPAGATNIGGLDLYKAAERFRALVELGQQMSVNPQLEVWGFSKNLSRLSEVLFVAAECGHPQTRILPDIYHLYKGGSDFDGLKLMSGPLIEIFHVNDYPAEPARTDIADKDRVYPGDGVAPVSDILRDLNQPGTPKILSLELFNRTLWEQDALEVAKTGLAKMKSAVALAIQ
ncbi:MAG: sugar phosphate isomerase/epimerase family protein [Bacteroidia bacterium]